MKCLQVIKGLEVFFCENMYYGLILIEESVYDRLRYDANQSLYKFLRTDKIHPIIRHIQLERELRELSVASEEELLSLE